MGYTKVHTKHATSFVCNILLYTVVSTEIYDELKYYIAKFDFSFFLKVNSKHYMIVM
jgi:hypothetical protein